jgi:hypothetical protein
MRPQAARLRQTSGGLPRGIVEWSNPRGGYESLLEPDIDTNILGRWWQRRKRAGGGCECATSIAAAHADAAACDAIHGPYLSDPRYSADSVPRKRLNTSYEELGLRCYN